MKNRRDEQIGVIVHIHREMSQGNTPCNYLYTKQAKMSLLFFFYFFFYKIREQECGTGPAWKGGTSGSGEDVGEGEGG
jgi:hypothetical protein